MNGGEGGAVQPAIDGRSRHIVDNYYGNQQKSRNFEKLGDNLGCNVIHGDSTTNTAINSRPTRAFIFIFNFKLTDEN